ncbi:MAG: alpha/beta hydrolase [Variovorax sp.]|nr:alpha/beta hydrolase [Variovorax sp.]
MDQPPTSTLRVRDTEIRVDQHGAGPATLLFLHGSDGRESWGSVPGRLADNARCLVPEHPGYGGTDAPAWLDHIADLANFYLELIEQQSLGKVHLIGHDLGGWIAAEMAVRNSSALASLTLVSAAGLHVEGVPVVDVFLRTDEELWRDSVHDAALARELAGAARTDAQDMALIKNKEVTARLTWQPRGHDPQLAKWLRRISVPTLVAWGAEDRILPPAYAQAWSEQIAGARRVDIAACGHLPALEKPAELASAIAQFISSSRSHNA